MYHRVAAPPADPWGLAVTPRLFADQLAVLAERRIVMRVDEFVLRHKAGDLPPEAAAITFDDGYLDNLTGAEPLLDAAGLPATLFLTTGSIGSGQPYWWDELATIVQTGVTCGALTVTIDGAPTVIDLSEDIEHSTFRLTWRAWQPPANAREAAYQTLWHRIQRCSADEKRACLKLLREKVGGAEVAATDLPMSLTEARALVGSRFEIGAHAETHRPLTALQPEQRNGEIERSRDRCEEIAGAAVTGFAYPHGDFDAATSDAVRQAGFAWACGTREATVERDDDCYALPRIGVGNIDGKALIAQIEGGA